MTYNVARSRSQKKPSTASRGIRSLSIAIVIPVALTVTNIMMFEKSDTYKNLDRPFWIPPLWVIHLFYVSSALVMGLSAWLVWADSGFHRTPMAIVMYLAQLGLGLAWDSIFFKEQGATQTGLAVSLGHVVTTFSCSWMFGRINPIAGDLVKLCLVWALFLTCVNIHFVLED